MIPGGFAALNALNPHENLFAPLRFKTPKPIEIIFLKQKKPDKLALKSSCSEKTIIFLLLFSFYIFC